MDARVTVQRTIDGFAVVDAIGHTLALRDSRQAAAYAAAALGAGGARAAIHVPQRPKHHTRPDIQASDLFDDPELLSLHSES